MLFEFVKLGRCWLQAGEGKRGTAGESRKAGLRGRGEFFCGKFFVNEVIDGIIVGRDSFFFRKNKTPVVFVLRPLCNPFFDEIFLFCGERAVGVPGGHWVIFVKDAVDDFRIFGVSGDDGGGSLVLLVSKFGEVEGDVGFTGFWILPVAVETILREDGTDVLVVTDLFFGTEGGDESKEEEETFSHEVIAGVEGCCNGARLRKNVFDDVSVHIGEPVLAALEFVGELGVINAELVEEGGVEVVDVDGLLVMPGGVGFNGYSVFIDEVVAEVIGLAEGGAWLDTAAGGPE